jgi:hypothetical protein
MIVLKNPLYLNYCKSGRKDKLPQINCTVQIIKLSHKKIAFSSSLGSCSNSVKATLLFSPKRFNNYKLKGKDPAISGNTSLQMIMIMQSLTFPGR